LILFLFKNVINLVFIFKIAFIYLSDSLDKFRNLFSHFKIFNFLNLFHSSILNNFDIFNNKIIVFAKQKKSYQIKVIF
jgi:hypothetical protein